MPIYEYQCKKCKAHIEVIQKINDKAPAKCRKCGGKLEKQVSAAAIQFKGSGFYVNDYARPGKNGKKSGDSADTATASDKGSDKGNDKASDKSGSDKSGSEKSASEKSGSKETSPVKKTSDSASSTKASGGD